MNRTSSPIGRQILLALLSPMHRTMVLSVLQKQHSALRGPSKFPHLHSCSQQVSRMCLQHCAWPAAIERCGVVLNRRFKTRDCQRVNKCNNASGQGQHGHCPGLHTRHGHHFRLPGKLRWRGRGAGACVVANRPSSCCCHSRADLPTPSQLHAAIVPAIHHPDYLPGKCSGCMHMQRCTICMAEANR